MDQNRVLQTQIQQALEARAVFSDPARLIAARAVRQGLTTEEVVELFEVHLCQAKREQARNPLGAVVWRLQQQPLHLPRRVGGGGTRTEEIRVFLADPLAEGETAGWADPEDVAEELPSEPADECRGVWQAILDELRLQMTRATFEQWLKDTRLEEMEEGVLVVSTPNPYAPELLEHRLGRLIRQTLQRQVGEGVRVRYVVR